jgi:broad specificity phosphatase PhoE
MPLDEVERRHPEAQPVSPYAPWFGTGESEAEFHRRAGAVVECLVRLELPSVLVVAHGGVLNAMLRNALGAPLPTSGGPYFMFGDAGYARLSYDVQQHSWAVQTINDTRHLEAGGQSP